VDEQTRRACNKVIDKLKEVVQLLVEQRYSELDSITNKKWVSGYDLVHFVREYGETLVMPPPEVFDHFFYENEDTGYRENERFESNLTLMESMDPHVWTVLFTMWTLKQGRSEYVLTLTVNEIGAGQQELRLHQLNN
jgi:hypothetical protein